ncbi:MAG: lamin tail domain-containing protein, partial [Candidatus Zixiibacteriota bacterium]
LGDSDGVAVLPPNVGRMSPGALWVLAENVPSFNAFYPGFEGLVWQVPGWRELGDHGDRVRLLGAAGEVIDSVSYAATYGTDRSTERRELTAAFADPRDWGGSVDPSGATPGRTNSIRRLMNDLALDSLMIVTPDSTWGSPVTIRGMVSNVGFGRVSEGRVEVFYVCDPDVPGASLFPDIEIGPLEPEHSTVFQRTWPAAPRGTGRISAVLRDDDNSSNNQTSLEFVIRFSQPGIIVSEFLADPPPGGPGEWIEICNMSGVAINLGGARAGDSSGTAALPAAGECMPPGAYWVLAEDASSFRSFYPGFTGELLEVDGWRELNNGGDRIRLIGAAGEIIDSLSYRETVGDKRSLERVELSATFATADDWAASVDPSGATPGRANSVDRQKAGSFRVDVSPNPFYRSRGEVAQIAYRMEIGEQLTLQVYDRTGHRVRMIVADQPAATGAIAWDARDDDGHALPPGPYILLARSDPSGATRKVVVVVGP